MALLKSALSSAKDLWERLKKKGVQSLQQRAVTKPVQRTVKQVAQFEPLRSVVSVAKRGVKSALSKAHQAMEWRKQREPNVIGKQIFTPSFERIKEGATEAGKATARYNPFISDKQLQSYGIKPYQSSQEGWESVKKMTKGGLTAYGLTSPANAIRATMGGGLISGGIQAGTNIVQGKPTYQGTGQAVTRGMGMGMANAGTTRLTTGLVEHFSKTIPLLKPFTRKNLKAGLPQANDRLKEGFSKWVNTSGKKLFKAAVIETLVETPIWATLTQTEKESFTEAIKREAIENFVLNVGMASFDSLTDLTKLMPAVKNSIGDAINKYQGLTSQEKQAGFAKLGKGVNPLIEEARKYKSAEEFIKAIGDPSTKTDLEDVVQFHGTQKGKELKNAIRTGNIRKSIGRYGEGFYLTSSQELGEYFGKQINMGGYRTMTKNKPDVFAFDLSNLKIKKIVRENAKHTFNQAELNKLILEGYDGVNLVNQGETVIVNSKKLKEINLTDIYNQAKGSVGKDISNQKLEAKLGWKNTGDKSKFDNALLSGDSDTVKKMLPGVPNDYRKRFSTEIDKVVKTTPLPGESIPGKAKTKAQQAEEGIIKEAKKGIGEYHKKKKGAKRTLNQFYTDWVNRFHPIEKIATKIEKEKGVMIVPSSDPRYAIKQMLGSGGTASLRHKQKLQPILDQVDQQEIMIDDLDIFLKAKRDIGFSEVGRKIKGSDPIKAQKVIDALSGKYDIDQLEDIASKFYTYQDNGLRMLQKAGFVDEKGYQAIKGANKNYVPFDRVMDDVDNYLGTSKIKAQQATQPIKKIKGSARKILSPLESIIADTYKIEAATSKNRVAQSLVNLRNISKEYNDMFEVVEKSGNNTISVWENGKKVFYDVGEDVSKAVKGLNEETAGVLTKILSAPASILRQGATGRNIGFMIPNIVKDQFDAAINSKYGYKPFVDYIRGLSHLVNYEKTGSDYLVEEWLRGGGKIFGGDIRGRQDIKEQILTAQNKKNIIKQVTDWGVQGFDVIGKYSESPTRIGLYKRAIEQGANEAQAIMETREATIDIARMGAKMKTANSLISFLNIGVQGFDKLIRTAKDDPGKLAIKMALYAMLPQTMVSFYNNVFNKEAYANVPNWEKENNFIVVTGEKEDGTPKYLKIPKGHIGSLVTNPIDSFISYLAGNDEVNFSEMAMSVLSETLPIIKQGSNLKEIASRTIGGNLPQAVKPVVENVVNYSFFKARPVVSKYKTDKPPLEQTTAYTPEAYNRIGRILNLSPLKIKNLLEGYFSGYVKVPVNIIETVSSLAKGEAVDINKIPIVRRFIGSYKEYTPTKTVSGNQIYDKVMELSTDERKSVILSLKKHDKKNYNKLIKHVTEKNLKLTKKEQQARSFSVRGRSIWIKEQMKGKTKEEKQQLWQRYKSLKIITKSVIEELAQ